MHKHDKFEVTCHTYLGHLPQKDILTLRIDCTSWLQFLSKFYNDSVTVFVF